MVSETQFWINVAVWTSGNGTVVRSGFKTHWLGGVCWDVLLRCHRRQQTGSSRLGGHTKKPRRSSVTTICAQYYCSWCGIGLPSSESVAAHDHSTKPHRVLWRGRFILASIFSGGSVAQEACQHLRISTSSPCNHSGPMRSERAPTAGSA